MLSINNVVIYIYIYHGLLYYLDGELVLSPSPQELMKSFDFFCKSEIISI